MGMKITKGDFSTFPHKMCKGLPAYEQITFIWLFHHVNADGICFPSLATLAEECGIGKDVIIKSLKRLEIRGYITKRHRKTLKGGYNSTLYNVHLKLVVNTDKIASNVVVNTDKVTPSMLSLLATRVVVNTDTNYNHRTKINTSTVNLEEEKSKTLPNFILDENIALDPKNNNALKIGAIKVLDYFKSIGGRKFRIIDSTLKPIIAILKTGVTVDECFNIIFMKHEEWKGTDFVKYLQPSTIFGKKNFENYYSEFRKKYKLN